MARFETRTLSADADTVAPDGAKVRLLLETDAGGMAHFELAPGQVSGAVTHRSVDEIWYVVSGRGEMWRKQGAREEVVELQPGVSLTIPLGTHFQFRADEREPLTVVAVTMPPWPGADQALAVSGIWQRS